MSCVPVYDLSYVSRPEKQHSSREVMSNPDTVDEGSSDCFCISVHRRGCVQEKATLANRVLLRAVRVAWAARHRSRYEVSENARAFRAGAYVVLFQLRAHRNTHQEPNHVLRLLPPAIVPCRRRSGSVWNPRRQKQIISSVPPCSVRNSLSM